MYKTKFVVILVLFITFASCNRSSNEKQNSEQMQIIQSKYDLKVVPADTIVNGFFVIKNVGNSTIMYKEVFTECRCTNLNIEKGDSIMAGKQDTIYFELNTEGMESGESIKKTIRIVTNTTPELHRFFIFGKIK